MKAGDLYLIPGFNKHHWVIISEPSLDKNHLVVVMVASWKPHCDQICFLEVGDHQFIKHRTCVEYHAARIETEHGLERLKSERKLFLQSPVRSDVLKRIRDGAAEADMRNDCLDVLRSQGIIE